MASGRNEHRMVFDIRGRRRHVVKFVYAILAVLMGASLFLVVGPVNIGELFGNGSSTSASSQFEDQAQRIESKLVKAPEDETLLLALTRARVNAGNNLVSSGSSGEIVQTVASVQQYQKASAAWSEYLEATKEPVASIAQLMSQVLFSLAQVSRTGNEAEANVEAAAEAQKIVAEKRPSLGSLSTLAFYQLYAFEYAAAEKSKREAVAKANTKFERENLENQFDEISKRAHEFQKQLAEAEKAEKAAKGASKGSLENPLGTGLGGSPPSE
ncbi:MAG: hypothetical protein U0R26_04580 [Solirubrobacterales bacterium]